MTQHPNVLERFGQRIRKLRTQRGISQEAFADLCGLDRTYISGIERGKRNVSLRNIEVLAQALGVSISIGTDSGRTILETWGVSAEYLTQVVEDNPSLRGMIVGYIAEKKLFEIFDQDDRASRLRKDDDHDRSRKGDLVITYRGLEFKIEVKSLQTNQIEVLGPDEEWVPRILKVRDRTVSDRAKYNYVPNPEFDSLPEEYRLTAKYRGAAQCDASDRRRVELPDGTAVETTCLKVGEFDLLAAGLFGFREQWDFGFALNRDLPRSNYAKYPEAIRSQLLKSLMPVTWPLSEPYTGDPFILLDQLVEERQSTKP